MAQAVEEWYKQMPMITRSYLTAAIITSVGCYLDIISLYNLYLNPKLVLKNYQFDASSPTFFTSEKWVYVWSKQNPFINMSFLGLFTFTAGYLPWVLLGFSVLVGASPWVDLLAMIAGHAYYYLEDVYLRMTGHRPLKTPSLIRSMFADGPVVMVRPDNVRFAAPPIEEQPQRD